MAFNGFVDEFSNGPIQPTFSSYLAIDLATESGVVLEWAFINQNAVFPFSQTIQVKTNTNTENYIQLPDATETSVGQTTLILNTSATAFNILYADEDTVLTSIGAGIGLYITLTDNSTSNGTWIIYQLGATPSSFVAADLIDNDLDTNGHGEQGGLKAFSTFLKQNIKVNTFTEGSIYNQAEGDRGSLLVWTSGTGIYQCLASDYTSGGFPFMIANNSDGAQITVTPQSGDTINGLTTPFILYPGESSIFTTDGLATIYSYGDSRSTSNVVTLVDIPLNSTTLTLSTLQSSYSIQKYQTGSASGVVSVIYPATTIGQWIAFNNSANRINVSVNGGSNSLFIPPQESLNIFSDGSDLYTDPSFSQGDVYLPNGSVSEPSLSFITDPTTGLYYTSGSLNVAVGGDQVAFISGLLFGTDVPIAVPSGSVGAPAFTFNSNTESGFYYSISPSVSLNITIAGIQISSFDSTHGISTINGSLANPSFTFLSDKTIGLYYSSGQLNVSVQGVSPIHFTSTHVVTSVPISASSGSVSAPSISFSSQTNTGFYYTTNSLDVAVQGIETTLFQSTLTDSKVPITSVAYQQSEISIYSIMRAYS